MKFYLFSKIEFEIPDPISIIECYCYQSDFYSKYDVIENRTVEDVNRIGARLKSKTISDCIDVIEDSKKLAIFQNTLDQFLDLERKEREEQIKELDHLVFRRLLNIKGIRFSTATKFYIPLTPRLSR